MPVSVIRLPFRLVGASLLFVVVMLGLTQTAVSAHNAIVESNPKNGARLASAPLEWTLTFKNDVPLDSASAEVIDSTGVRTTLLSPRYGVDQKQIIFLFPQNLTGEVTARWKLVSTDGHVVTERVTFSIGVITTTTALGGGDTKNTLTTPTVGDDEATTPDSVRYSLRLAGYFAVLLFGGLLFNLSLLGPRLLSFSHARTTQMVASLALAVTPFLQLLIFLDDVERSGVLGSVFQLFNAFDTTAGSMLFMRTLIGVALVVIVLRGMSMLSLPTVILSVMYLFSLSYVGHSRSMAWPLLGIPADIIHTGAVTVWLGGLAVLVVLVLPHTTPSESLAEFRRYGGIAQTAVIAIVVTGVIQTVRLHGTVITLITESHGRWLVLKLVVVAAMLKIGDINRRRILRDLPDSEAIVGRHVALIRRASVTEIATGGAVMLVTTILVTSSVG